MGDPSHQILVRTPEGIDFLKASIANGKLNTSPADSPLTGASSIVWSKHGIYCAALGPNKVTVFSSKSKVQEEARLDIPELHAVAFSPKATYLITFQRPNKEAGNADKNLKLWDWRTGDVKLQLHQKSFTRDTWPQLQLTASEDFALHLITNAVNAFDTASPAGVAKKLSLKGVGGFAVSPDADAPVVAAFVPEGKGIPGFVGLWRLDELQKGPTSPSPYCRRSFFRATSARLLWNAKGSALLAITASETDASNKSYYGEQKLHFLAANGTNDCLVPLPKEGPVHDVQWSPSGDHFVVVSGFMPAKINLFSSRCQMLQELTAGPYNMVRWNQQGRFLAIAGFGNLPGDVGFFELTAKGTCKPLGAAKAEDGVTMEWSPSGRTVMTATTAPRLRVNNGIQVFRYDGEVLGGSKFQVLLEASWRPADPAGFDDRPASPQRSSGGNAPPASAAPIRAAGYVPPHARNSSGASSSGGHFSLAREKESTSSRLGSQPKSRVAVPGAEPLPQEGAGKKKRNRGGKKGGGDGEAAAKDSAVPATGAVAPRAEAAAEGVEGLDLKGGAAAAAAGGDPAKRARNLKKKLTQIQQLREKIASGALTQLEPEQQAKLDSEAGILAELKSLGESN